MISQFKEKGHNDFPIDLPTRKLTGDFMRRMASHCLMKGTLHTEEKVWAVGATR